MSDDGPERDIDRLDRRLREAMDGTRADGFSGSPKNLPDRTSAGLAFRVGVELVSALAVGAGLGWLLDEWLGTRPWLMLVFVLLGAAAGILNVFRVARGHGYAVGYQSDEGSPDTKADSTSDRRASGTED